MILKNKIVKRILIVGSWGKEQATIQNIRKYTDCGIFVYMDTQNPAIMDIADDCYIGNFSEINAIVNYAKASQIDLALLTTAAPLNLGLANALEVAGIPAFGPFKNAAQLESNKAFTRRLLKKVAPEMIPAFRVFEEKNPAIEYAKQLDYQVAVKPLGLTDGLGVKVYGDQLENEDDVIDYICYILQEKYSGFGAVLIEEKLVGEEFTLQCLVNDEKVIATPTVQDFKKLLPGERGVNTASMGSYSAPDRLLPFLTEEDYQQALKCIRKTLKAFKNKTGEICRGFLYGQFMVVEDGVKLIEYNFRPGDPEWMNTMAVLQNNLIEAIIDLYDGKETKLNFSTEATICQYVVPPEYPVKLNEILEVTINREIIEKSGANLYFSCGIDSNGKYQVGTERGIALVATGKSIEIAYNRVKEGLKGIKGEYFHRPDIGTAETIQEKINHVRLLRETDLIFKRATEDDFLQIREFVTKCPPLESYPMHIYKIILRYFSSTCYIAYKKKNMVGWLMGFISQKDDETYFLWQVGISPNHQGEGIGSRILKHVEKDIKKWGCRRVEVTIEVNNLPSQKLFEKNSYRNVSYREGETIMINNNEVAQDYYGPDRNFMVYEKNLNLPET